MIISPTPDPEPAPDPFPGVNAQTMIAVNAALALMPPCSAASWGTEAYLAASSALTVTRLCASGFALVRAESLEWPQREGRVHGRFTAWSALTGVGVHVNGTGGVHQLIFWTGAKVLCSTDVDPDDPALPTLLADVFAAKEWT